MRIKASHIHKQRLNAAVCAIVLVLACVIFGQGVHAEIVQDISKYLPYHPPEGDPQYVLEENPYLPFCKKVDAHLRANPDMNRIDACDFPVTPKADGFTKPTWEVLDPNEHMDIVREIFMQTVFWRNYQNPYLDPLPSREEQDKAWNHDPKDPTFHLFREDFPDGREVHYTLREFLDKGLARLERARFDLDFDGKQDTVYRFRRGSCDPLHPQTVGKYSWSYHVLERDGLKLHEQITATTIRGIFDILRYGGRTYLAAFFVGTVFIYETYYDRGRQLPTSYMVCQLSIPLNQNHDPNHERD